MAQAAPSKAAPKGELVTRERMALIAGIAKTTLDTWVQRGCPVYRPSPRKGVPSQYDTAAVLEWRNADLVGEAGDGIVAEKEKARLYRAQAGFAELRLRRAADELVSATEVLKVRSTENAALRDRLRSIPSSVADRVIEAVTKGGKAPQVAALILREIDEALEDIADAEFLAADPPDRGGLGGDDHADEDGEGEP
jgi:phage terminase Nu1 subunit (DNA packaging protein)